MKLLWYHKSAFNLKFYLPKVFFPLREIIYGVRLITTCDLHLHFVFYSLRGELLTFTVVWSMLLPGNRQSEK